MIPEHVTVTEVGGLVRLLCRAMTIRYDREEVCGGYTYGTREAAERDAVSLHSHTPYKDPS